MLAYDNPHKAPWNWIVSAYTWTKSVAAGLLLVAAVLGIVGYDLDRDFQIVTTVVAGIFLAITAALLVLDLHHPKRFLYTLLKPQWRSGVARGSYLITGYGMFLGVYFIALIADFDDAVSILRWPVAILALGAGVYTAFLFGQAKGRDLWQEPGLPLHFLAQVGTAGAAGLVLVLALLGTDAQRWSAASFGPSLPAELSDALRWIFLIVVAANLALMLGHIMMSNASMDRRRALHNLLRGRFSMFYWGGALFGGLVPLVLVVATNMTGAVGAIAAVSALIGLAAYQHAYVQAGQSVPQS